MSTVRFNLICFGIAITIQLAQSFVVIAPSSSLLSYSSTNLQAPPTIQCQTIEDVYVYTTSSSTCTELYSSIRRPGPIRRKQQQRQPAIDDNWDNDDKDDENNETTESNGPGINNLESSISRQSTTATTRLQSTSISNTPVGSSLLYSLDPYSNEAIGLLRNGLKLTDRQINQIQELCTVLLLWNERINLVSRKDCTIETIFGRHVLPSLAPIGDPYLRAKFSTAKRCIDVGTGGGFPGLPLAVAFPETHFVLLDSVQKKLLAIDDMVKSIGINNVKTYNGRSESYKPPVKELYTIVTGRSVSAVPQFCSWVSHLLQPKDGHLIYWIGGQLDQSILSRLQYREDVQTIFGQINTYTTSEITSDKQIFVMPAEQVKDIGTDFVKVTTAAASTASRSQTGNRFSTTRSDGWDSRTSNSRRHRPMSEGINIDDDHQQQQQQQNRRHSRSNDIDPRRGKSTKLAKGEWRKKKTSLPVDHANKSRRQDDNWDSYSEGRTSSSRTSNISGFRRYKSTSSTTYSSGNSSKKNDNE